MASLGLGRQWAPSCSRSRWLVFPSLMVLVSGGGAERFLFDEGCKSHCARPTVAVVIRVSDAPKGQVIPAQGNALGERREVG